MTLRDRLLPAIDRIRGLRQTLGITVNAVRLRVETWTAAIGTAGATATTVDVLMAPQPKVSKLSVQDAMVVMASLPAAQVARGQRGIYLIGPITPSYSTGGYTLAELYSSAQASDQQRVLIMLAGDNDLGAAPGTPFEIVNFDTSKPFRTMLTVIRAQDL